ncbi:tapasin-related protein isoform X2 [Girardinichthys multiradiatus]|uniref:tapasin-related protein isoform X2 n=1 Tax=Girardinichthys multiradiatus TaxID=208333 RepID=UPI001FAE5EBE|nr:tapasin-related protein isoform X2 [Girardinichthys multiradiatus]
MFCSLTMIEVLFFGLFLTFVNADGVADVVLSCSLVEEGAGLGGMGGGALFTRTPATLVLRDIPVGPDESLDTLTPFVPPSVPDPDLILFENKVSSPEIPNAGMLLHADCNEQEVMCEISRYTPRGLEEGSDPAYFMVSLSVVGFDFSTSLILQTLPVDKDQQTLVQNKLSLPLSQSGTLLTKDVLLNCGFKQEEIPLAPEVGLEWRLQHRGKGRKVLEIKTKLDDTEGATVVHGERKGSSVDGAQVLSEGNVSMSVTELKVVDEGTYICTVNLGHFHAQQIIQLHIIQPPQVSLSEEKLFLSKSSPQTLSCHCAKYYPLEAQMEWFFLPPTETEPKLFPNQGSLSSHRQHGDRTFSLSSHITVPPSFSPGTKITCRVSHPALDEPLYVSIVVESPQSDSYWWVLGFLVVTVLFFYQVMK